MQQRPREGTRFCCVASLLPPSPEGQRTPGCGAGKGVPNTGTDWRGYGRGGEGDAWGLSPGPPGPPDLFLERGGQDSRPQGVREKAEGYPAGREEHVGGGGQQEGKVLPCTARRGQSLFILGFINSEPWCHQSSNHTADSTDLIGKRCATQKIKVSAPINRPSHSPSREDGEEGINQAWHCAPDLFFEAPGRGSRLQQGV